ncbi:hypothetical protein [Haliangium sp.]|uniref:hypothetical protein n=1 Tax=Haliangium sp. TaxID=2663208 RepID=UPI003D1208EC
MQSSLNNSNHGTVATEVSAVAALLPPALSPPALSRLVVRPRLGLAAAALCAAVTVGLAGGCGSDPPPPPTPDAAAGTPDAAASPDASSDAALPDATPAPDAGPPPGFDFPERFAALDSGSRNWFGYSVDISGDVIVVGAPFYDLLAGGEVLEPSIGAAYVFERDGTSWKQTARLSGSTVDTSSMFGWSVGVDGDLIAVGAWGQEAAGSQVGTVYVFERNATTWEETAILEPLSGDDQTRFGQSVSVSGNRIAVGAPNITDVDDNDPVTPAYVFEKSGQNWNGVRVEPTDDPRDSWFGYSVSLSGDTLVVGAPADKTHGRGSGAAYVFEVNGANWNQVARFDDANGEIDDYFGRDVAVDGNVIAIGVEAGGAVTALNQGMVVVYENDGTGWSESARVQASDPDVDHRFGFSVDVYQGIVVVGAHRDDEVAIDAGSAYIFRKQSGQWEEYSKLISYGFRSGDQCGAAVAMDGTSVVLGARFADEAGTDSGSMYVFEMLDGM